MTVFCFGLFCRYFLVFARKKLRSTNCDRKVQRCENTFKWDLLTVLILRSLRYNVLHRKLRKCAACTGRCKVVLYPFVQGMKDTAFLFVLEGKVVRKQPKGAWGGNEIVPTKKGRSFLFCIYEQRHAHTYTKPRWITRSAACLASFITTRGKKNCSSLGWRFCKISAICVCKMCFLGTDMNPRRRELVPRSPLWRWVQDYLVWLKKNPKRQIAQQKLRLIHIEDSPM